MGDFSTRRRPRLKFIALTLIIGLAGCSTKGDFGRPRPGVYNDTIVPGVASVVRGVRGVGVEHDVSGSDFELTGDEADLRALSYSLTNTEDDESWARRYHASIAVLGFGRNSHARRRRVAHTTGLAPYEARGHIPEAAVLHARILTDLDLARGFKEATLRVYRADDRRVRFVRRSGDLPAPDIHDAAARIRENRQIVTDTILAVENRIDAYWLDLRRSELAFPHGNRRAIESELHRLAFEMSDLRHALRRRTRPRS